MIWNGVSGEDGGGRGVELMARPLNKVPAVVRDDRSRQSV